MLRSPSTARVRMMSTTMMGQTGTTVRISPLTRPLLLVLVTSEDHALSPPVALVVLVNGDDLSMMYMVQRLDNGERVPLKRPMPGCVPGQTAHFPPWRCPVSRLCRCLGRCQVRMGHSQSPVSSSNESS